MIGHFVGRLKIIEKIGEGGMGKVYLAEHTTMGKNFAVKCLAPELTGDPEFQERFNNEARSQAKLGHINIV